MERVDDSSGKSIVKDPLLSERVLSRRNMITEVIATLLLAEPVVAVAAEKKETLKPLPSVTDATFAKEVLESQKPVLLVFYSESCGPCRTVDAILRKLQNEFGETILILRMNRDTNTSDLRYKGNPGRLVPYCIYFTRRYAMDSSIGAETEEIIRARIQRLIATHAQSEKKK